ncbi:MAG: hypothetical protein KBS81_08465, partial [Spirochaetales bacterium]|nr:hypothetical protein [Candidatus Physcosoma equi]
MQLFNEDLPKNTNAVLSYIKSDEVCICASIGYKYKESPDNVAKKAMDALGFKYSQCVTDEITVRSYAKLVRDACHEGFIEDEDAVLTKYCLDSLCMCINNESYEEKILQYNEEDADALPEVSSKSFSDELDRINDDSSPKTFVGMPVHYIIRADNPKVLQSIVGQLLLALHNNCRIKSRRYTVLKPEVELASFLDDDDAIPAIDVNEAERIFTLQAGGAVVFQPCSKTETGIFVSKDSFNLDKLGKIVSKHRLDTLAIVAFKRCDNQYVEAFKNASLGVRYIEISEDMVSIKHALDYLKALAEADGIEDCSSLLA